MLLKKRNFILTVLAAISTIAFACLPLFGGATAYADGITEANFYMESGASIYINKDYTDDDGNILSGVKFRAYVPDNTNTYGMLIVPNDYLSKAEILISSGTDYVTAFAAAYEAGKIKKPATVVKGLEIKQDGSKYYVEHSIVDILANNYDRNWFGIAFCETAEDTYVYAKSNNNVRSIEYVSSAILNQVAYNSANLSEQEKELYTENKSIFSNIVSTAIENVVGENGSVSYELNGNETMTEKYTQTLTLAITKGVNVNTFYSVSDEDVATIDQSGVLTAKTAGDVTVYAKSYISETNVLEDSIAVTVKEFNPVMFDGDIQEVTLTSTKTDNVPTIAIIDSGDEEHGKVYSYSYSKSGSTYDQYIKLNDISDKIAVAKELGYTKLSIDVKYTSDNAKIILMGCDIKSSAKDVWETKKVDLDSLNISQNPDANVWCFWLSNFEDAIYIDNIKFIKAPKFTMEYGGESYVIELTNATASGATAEAIDDPTNSGKGIVYKWAGGSSGSHNTNASWTNIADLVTKAKAAGYEMFCIDVYRDSICGGTGIHINKWAFTQTKTGEWETIKVSLDSAEDSNLMWMQNGGGYILFANFRFEKYNPVMFDGEIQEVTLTSTHTGNPTIAVVDSGDEEHGKVYSYSHTAGIYDQYIKLNGISDKIAAAKALGYTKLSIDVKYTSGNAIVKLMGCDIKPSAKDVWETKTLDLDDLSLSSSPDANVWCFWLSEAGAIYIDNITFVK